MALADFYYWLSKGSALSPSEVDANFAELQRRTRSGWKDNVMDVTTRGGANSPTLAPVVGGIYLYEFQAGQMMEVFANFHVNHDYKLGTMIYPHIHFTITNAVASGNVRWGFEWTQAQRNADSGGTIFPATTTKYVEFAVPSGQALLHCVAELPEGDGIPATNLNTDSVIMMRVFRDGVSANDTYTQNVYGITVDYHYEADHDGTMYRAPPFNG